MRKTYIVVLAILLSACTSSYKLINNHPHYAPYIGKLVFLTEDLCLYKARPHDSDPTEYWLDRSVEFCLKKADPQASDQPIEVLKRGTMIEILDARSHTIPSGHVFHLVYCAVYVDKLGEKVVFKHVVGLADSSLEPLPWEFAAE